MAGTIFGLGLSQQFDINGDPMSGALLYLYQANSSTPVTAYQNFGLTVGQEHPWPIVADSTGRIPSFWLADGSYRARLTDAMGVPVFDEQNVEALGPSSGGGGGGDTTDPNSVSSTGDVKWRPINTTLAGWVRINGRTIGSATSGASERANADTQTLYEYIWNNFSDTLAPVLTGRGASAAADFAANKQITLLDMRGRSPFGVDDMGASSAGRLTGTTFAQGDAITGGGAGGANTHTLATAELPSHDHGGSTGNAGSHFHLLVANAASDTPLSSNPTQQIATQSTGGGYTLASTSTAATLGESDTEADHAHTVASQGGGGAHANMPPFMVGTWYWRL